MATGTMLDAWLWPWTMARTAAAVMETAWNAQSVIAARLPMIGEAMLNPLAGNHRELGLMVSEKSEAFGQAGRTWTAGNRTIQGALSTNAHDLHRLAGGTIFWPADWIRIAERNLLLFTTMVALPGTTLAPVQARAAANAKRLHGRR